MTFTLQDHRDLAHLAARQLDEAFKDLAIAEALGNDDRIAQAWDSIIKACDPLLKNAHAGKLLAEKRSDDRFDARYEEEFGKRPRPALAVVGGRAILSPMEKN